MQCCIGQPVESLETWTIVQSWPACPYHSGCLYLLQQRSQGYSRIWGWCLPPMGASQNCLHMKAIWGNQRSQIWWTIHWFPRNKQKVKGQVDPGTKYTLIHGNPPPWECKISISPIAENILSTNILQGRTMQTSISEVHLLVRLIKLVLKGNTKWEPVSPREEW